LRLISRQFASVIFDLRVTLKVMRKAYIGMGANLASWAGAPEATLAAATVRLASLGRIASRSSLYSTAPVGFAAQPRFVNAVVELHTALPPRQLLDRLLAIEQEFGRDRSAGIANGPRTLDLDILLFGEMKLSEPELQIPHPRLAQRLFVLAPLNQIAPSLLVPGCVMNIGELFQELTKNPRNQSNAVVQIQNDAWDSR
jgi:2-amino-4-hydroxy-6-hydroxymethyldihydropteridine diphosphokinase